MLGSLCGCVVRAEDESPIGGATVTIVSGAGPAPDIAPLTNSAGWFALDALPAGVWVLRALGPGRETGQATVSVFDYALTDVTIRV